MIQTPMPLHRRFCLPLFILRFFCVKDAVYGYNGNIALKAHILGCRSELSISYGYYVPVY
jgi:hypothetical protein